MRVLGAEVESSTSEMVVVGLADGKDGVASQSGGRETGYVSPSEHSGQVGRPASG
jgi:hypothetical protein